MLVTLIILACVMPKRPPVVIRVGTGYAPVLKKGEDQHGLAQIMVPARPVGFWIETRYDFGDDKVTTVTGGIMIYFPGEEEESEEKEVENQISVPPP